MSDNMAWNPGFIRAPLLAAMHLLAVGQLAFSLSLCASAGQTIVTFGDSTTAPRNVGASNNGRPAGFSSAGSTRTSSTNPPHNNLRLVDQTNGFLYVYSDQLRDLLTETSFNLEAVDNEGVGGNRTDQALTRLHEDVLSKEPQTVVVQFGLNDAAHDGGAGTESRVPVDFLEQSGGDGILGNGNDHPFAHRGNYIDNLTQIVQTLQDGGVRTILMTPNQVIPSTFRTIDRLELYVQAVRDIAASNRASLLDVWQIYEEVTTGPATVNNFLLDGLHPNGLGHRLVAEPLFAMIVPEPQSAMLLLGGLHFLSTRHIRLDRSRGPQ